MHTIVALTHLYLTSTLRTTYDLSCLRAIFEHFVFTKGGKYCKTVTAIRLDNSSNEYGNSCFFPSDIEVIFEYEEHLKYCDAIQ